VITATVEVQQQFEDALLAHLESIGIDIDAIISITFSSGSLVVEIETSEQTATEIESAAARGSVVVEVEGVSSTAGDTITGGQVSQSASTSTNQDSSTSFASVGTMAGAFIAAFAVVFIVSLFVLVSQTKPQVVLPEIAMNDLRREQSSTEL
jgi:hypothetical protein